MQIINTKLSSPPLRARLVERPRLIQKLNQGFECGFVLVSAAAGYGKSTLLSFWLDQCDSPFTWLSLDDGDNHPIRFLTYLISALRKIDASVGEELEAMLRESPLPDVETLLTSLVNELTKVARPFCLVLDDYHLIQNQTVHQMVGFLLEHRPASLHLIISTRADPPLPLARLRARSEMLELRQSDLCFSALEAADFLTHTMGLQISSNDVAHITTRTEGWIAGLQMAGLSIQNSDDIPGLIATLTGSHYHIFNYLMEEIIARQSTEIRRFLLNTSILNQMTPSLCDALLAEDSGSTSIRPSADLLEELVRANLFILPLDPERRWYRYHHLFSDLLKLLLEKSHPGLSIGLHLRACHWYEAQGMIPAALQHAISSGDMQLVAQIVSANVLVLVENDEVTPTLHKIDSLPLTKITDLPWLGIARAWVLGAGHIQQSLEILDTVEITMENAPASVERQRLKGHIAAARAFVLCAQGDTTQTIEYARLANELLPANEIAVRAMNLTRWGDVLIDSQKDFSALPILEQALALALQAEKPHVAMIASAALASAYMHAGMLHKTQHTCLDALAIAEEYQARNRRPLSVTAEIYSILARVLAEWGEYDQAIQFARKGLTLSEYLGLVSIESLCLSHFGRILVHGNELEQARKAFQRAENAAHKISTWFWQVTTIFALDALLDRQAPDASEIAQQMRRVHESSAQYPTLLSARLLLKKNQPDQALVRLDQAQVELKGHPSCDTVRIHALRALALHAKGDETDALASLQLALELGASENRVMAFVREGAEMERLLHLAQAKGVTSEFIRRLQAAFESQHKLEPAPAIPTGELLEPLSKREHEILKLLAQGCADKQIAEILVLSRGTVHKHLENIYEKLDVHSRTEAIARGRELNLL